MAADVATTLPDWSTTAANNAPAGSTAISTNLDDNLRQIQAVVRTLAASDTIASATTTDLSTKTATFITVSGTTAITALGTEEAGIYKWLVFAGALTFTHNATSLILPSGANITTAAGDVACMLSLGSGNWRCVSYMKANGKPVVTGVSIDALDDASAAGAITMAAYAQTWTWEFTANDQAGLVLDGGSSAGDRTNTYVLKCTTNDAGVGPFLASHNGNVMIDADETGQLTLASGSTANTIVRGFDRTVSDTGAGGILQLLGGAGHGGAGGAINITSGSNGDAGSAYYAGGDITIETGTAVGSSSAAGGGSVLIQLGEGSAAATDGDFRVRVTTQDVFIVDGGEEHVYVSGAAAPAFKTGSGGTGGSKAIAGRDNAFVATMGGTPGTSCTFTFAKTWATAPVVSALTSKAGVSLSITAVSTTEVTIATSSAWADGDKLHVMCMGYV